MKPKGKIRIKVDKPVENMTDEEKRQAMLNYNKKKNTLTDEEKLKAIIDYEYKKRFESKEKKIVKNIAFSLLGAIAILSD